MLWTFCKSRYANTIDKKGRVSIPAQYRNILGASVQNIVIYPSLKNQCIEACSVDRINNLMQLIDDLQEKEILFKHLSWVRQ